MQLKLKHITSILILAFFALLGGGSFDDGDFTLMWVFGAILVIAGVIGVISENNKEKERRQKANEQLQARMKKEQQEKEEFDAWFEEYMAENGAPDKTIITEANKKEGAIFVHEKSRRLFLIGRHYDFKDILSCTFTDNPTVIKGAVSAVTKSKTGSTIGRAIVGDVIAGPAGAIIGGTTGKKVTEFKQENDRTIHDYTVVININSIATPILRINTGSNGRLTNEIVGLMNVIISRK